MKYLQLQFAKFNAEEMYYNVENQYALVHWEGEDTASVVPCSNVSENEIGEVAEVKTAEGKFKGVVTAIGKIYNSHNC